MNIEAYNLDSLRKLVRRLQDENHKLKEQLKVANIPFDTDDIFEEETENEEAYDPDQGGRVIRKYITEDMARWYFSMFWGREDVFAKRGSKGGYFPQCNNRWNNRLCPKQRGEKITCEVCDHRDWAKLTPDKIIVGCCRNASYYISRRHVYRCIKPYAPDTESDQKSGGF